MFISRATGRFPREKFDTMLVRMLPRVPHTQQASKIIKLMSFEGSRGSPGAVYIPTIRHVCSLDIAVNSIYTSANL